MCCSITMNFVGACLTLPCRSLLWIIVISRWFVVSSANQEIISPSLQHRMIGDFTHRSTVDASLPCRHLLLSGSFVFTFVFAFPKLPLLRGKVWLLGFCFFRFVDFLDAVAKDVFSIFLELSPSLGFAVSDEASSKRSIAFSSSRAFLSLKVSLGSVLRSSSFLHGMLKMPG